MSKTPRTSIPYVNQGGVECMIGERGISIPITIDGTRLGSASANVTVVGPSLFARRTASPFNAVPFSNGTLVINPTNTTNATMDIADADAVKFRVGDTITYYRISTSALHTETKVISAIGATGSGGAGETLVTLTGVWTTPPVANDFLVVADGAQLSKNVCVVLEDVIFDGSTGYVVAGFIDGKFVKSAIENKTYFVQADKQDLVLVDIQP
ncbi:MAG: hypothetical protein HY880_08935 [Deltaproteobacteria bacterium]|nr:hypothetical protein [Deltaproteobacteria bacterium]